MTVSTWRPDGLGLARVFAVRYARRPDLNNWMLGRWRTPEWAMERDGDDPVPLVAAYFRPDSLEEALSLLAEPNRIPLAGGTGVNADREASDLEVVDLQALGLGAISADGDQVAIGATATLADLANSDLVAEPVRQVAKAESPSTLRTLSTVGGTVASADADSVLLAALLTAETTVQLAPDQQRPLGDVLRDGVESGAIITSISSAFSGRFSVAVTGRTPADVPIVSAVARQDADNVWLALTGVGPQPLLVDPGDPTSDLDPPDDFRGTRSYRLHLAQVLSARALEGLS